MSFEESYSKDHVNNLAKACEEVSKFIKEGSEEDFKKALEKLCLELPQGTKSYYYLKIRSLILKHIELLAKKASEEAVTIDEVVALTDKIHELTVSLSKL